MASPNVDADISCMGRSDFLGAATGPFGTTPVSAVAALGLSLDRNLCLGASFAGSRVIGTETASLSCVWRSA